MTTITLTRQELDDIRRALGYTICKVAQRRRWQERRELGGAEAPEKARNIYAKRGARIERLQQIMTRLESIDTTGK